MRYKNNKNLENNKSVRFYFDNKEYFGFEGDTLASALLANDQAHELNAPFTINRFSSGELVDEHGAAAVAH